MLAALFNSPFLLLREGELSDSRLMPWDAKIFAVFGE
jgi:hypothetical protein